MTTFVLHSKGLPWHRRYATYFREGFLRHGIRVDVTDADTHQGGDVEILFGPNYWKKVENAGRPYLMVNRAFLGDHNDNVAIGWDGLNGRSRFCVTDIDEERWLKFVDPKTILGWREVGEYLLLMGQADLGRCGKWQSLNAWYQYIKQQVNENVIFRPHPGGPVPLSTHLRLARLAVTLNSTVSVKSIVAGVPTVAMDPGNPCWGICGHTLGEEKRPKRIPFLKYLAHCQWNWLEIKRGDFWDQLKVYEGQPLCDYRGEYEHH